MIKRILNIIKSIALIILISVSSYLVGLFGSADYNMSLHSAVLKSLTYSNNYVIFSLNCGKKTFEGWTGFTKPYNSDFIFHSAAVRISSDSYELRTVNDEILNVAFSDFVVSDIYQTPRNNYSLLSVNSNVKEFKNNAIIINDESMNALGLQVGDVLYLDEEKTMGFAVAGSYSNNERHLNTFYYEIGDPVAFIGVKYFDTFVKDSYNGYLGISNQNNKYIDAYWKEFYPFIRENNITLGIDTKFSQNNVLIDGMNPLQYQTYLYNKYQADKSSPLITIIKLVLILDILIALPFLFGGVYNVFKSFKKGHLIFVSLLFVFILGIGILVAKFGPLMLGLINKSGLSYSYVLSMQLLTTATFVALFGSIFYSIYHSYFDKTIVEYRERSLKLDDICSSGLSSDNESTILDQVNNVGSKPKVLFFGSFVAPDKSAGAIRVINFARMLAESGYKSYVSSLTDSLEPQKIYGYSDSVYLLPYAKAPKSVFKKFHLYLCAKKEVKGILNAFANSNPECIIIYSVFPLPSIRLIRKYCKKNNIKLIFDIVESHSFSQHKLSSLFATYFPNKILNNLVIKKNDNVIGISSYLCEKYKSKGCNVLRVPFINSVDDFTFNEKPLIELRNGGVEKLFVYIGNPAHRKDLLEPVVQVFNELSNKNYKLIIAGVNENDLILNEHFSKQTLMESVNNVVLLGKVSHDEIKRIYSIADYSILIRNPDKESAKAGFPTKVSESLFYGVPVITNISSDLSLYLNGDNSIIVEGFNKEEVKKAIFKAVSVDESDYLKMRKAARDTAENELSCNKFNKEFVNFIKE